MRSPPRAPSCRRTNEWRAAPEDRPLPRLVPGGSALRGLRLGAGRSGSGAGGAARGGVQVADPVADHRGELAARVEARGALVGRAGLVGLAGLLVRGAEEEAGVLRGLGPPRVLEEGLQRRDGLGEFLDLREGVAEAEIDDVVLGLRLELEVPGELLGGGAPVAAAESRVAAIEGGLGHAALHAGGAVVDRLRLERRDERAVEMDGLAHRLVQARAFLLGAEQVVDAGCLLAF